MTENVHVTLTFEINIKLNDSVPNGRGDLLTHPL